MKTNLNRKGFCLLFSLFLLAGGGGLYASDYHSMSQVQDNVISVSGTVKDTKGEPLIGVSVLVKGTTNGTVTDLDGKFTLKVSAGDILEFSYIGYASQSVTVTNANSLNITLSEDTQALDEVVVTALGIKREEKALSYNVQQVNADKLNAVKDVNFINSMVGKVAGVQINSGASGPGSATRVVMRGMKSIEKDNGVLYVIDGVPMYNKSFGGSGGTMTKMVGSESAADINSDDIESVNMLTGPSAAALYGSDAANGVIIINTKKGSAEKTTVTINNSTTFSTVYMMPQMQSRYGRSDGYMNWGEQLPSDYNYDPRKFFDTGSDVINSISLSTGNKKSQTYVSFATTNSKGIVPESSYNRYNFTARNTSKFANDKLTLDMGGSVIIQNDHNLVAQGTYNNPIPGLYLFPRGEDFNEVRTYERWNPTGIMTQYWPYTEGVHNIQNPYWIQNRNDRDMKKRRFMANVSLKYDITPWLNVVARANIDESYYTQTSKMYATTLTTFCGRNGGYSLDDMTDRSIYGDIIANVDKKIGDFRLLANVGASIKDQIYEDSYTAGDLVVANEFYTNNLNTATSYKSSQTGWHDQTQSIFASLELGWKDMLYFTATGRNDWASQLAFSDQASFFYPSVGISAVISNMLKMPEWLDFAKVRASYSKVSTPFERYLSNPSYTYDEQMHTWNKSKTYPNTSLKPEDTKSWEVGLNVRFLNGFNLDVTYYHSNTYHQTIYVPLAAATGYEKFVAQTGNIENKGVELAFGYEHQWGDFGWSSNLTVTHNKNTIKELGHGIVDPINGEAHEVSEIEKDWLGQANVAPRVLLREGGSMSDIYYNHIIQRDANGNTYVDNDGNIKLEETKEFVEAGSLAPKANLGWSNNFTYKGVSLGVVLAARFGGLVYSATQGILDYYGTSEYSAKLREQGGVPCNFGMLPAKSYLTTIGTAQGGHAAYYMYSATNIRLQELAVSYTFPKKWFNDKLGLTIGVVGRNLAMLYCDAPFDPELSAATGSNYYQGVDYFMLPSTRNFGFNIKLQF